MGSASGLTAGLAGVGVPMEATPEVTENFQSAPLLLAENRSFAFHCHHVWAERLVRGAALAGMFDVIDQGVPQGALLNGMIERGRFSNLQRFAGIFDWFFILPGLCVLISGTKYKINRCR